MGTALSAERQAEIFRKVLKLELADTPIRTTEIAEKVFHVAKQIGEKPEEFAELVKPIFEEILAEAFKP